MFPQLPQFCGSESVAVQVWLQTMSPVGHAQFPPEQDAPVAQTWPQVPQLVTSEVTFVQSPPHTMSPLGHSQAPLEHDAPVAQTFPQDPQLCTSDSTPIQPPLQKSWPLGQASQEPPMHCGIDDGQTFPQVPQFMGSVIVVEHVPSQFVFPSAGQGS
jgi:hypothetical protein